MKTLVLGVGNPLLCDDGVGIRVVRKIKKLLGSNNVVDIAEAHTLGISILDYIRGYSKVIIVDSLVDKGIPVGCLKELEIGQIKKISLLSNHNINLLLGTERGKMCDEFLFRPYKYELKIEEVTTFKVR